MITRLRRLRGHENIRALVRETGIDGRDLIQPIFIEEHIDRAVPIAAMPGIFRIPETKLSAEIKSFYRLGLRHVMPFGISHHKDDIGSDTSRSEGLLARIIERIKQACPEMIVIPDLCFCEYTTHGHCGVVCDGDVDNDMTLELLAKQALVAARAGADFLAPSAMMDGQVAVIRSALDSHGFHHVGILAHAVKFASAFYGPFRQAAGCNLPGQENRCTYQLDPANARQSLLEAQLDENEGADILMVKPGLPYLDILQRLRQQTNKPLAAYQVSGEYAMIKHAAQAGACNEQHMVLESLLALKRAGADMIVSYFAQQVVSAL